jgi:hypothetical protein
MLVAFAHAVLRHMLHVRAYNQQPEVGFYSADVWKEARDTADYFLVNEWMDPVY